MPITRELMSSFLDAVQSSGHGLFETTDGWAGKLEAPFNAWAATQEHWVFSEQAGDASMTERLMKDEECGELLADFVSSLPEAQSRMAIEGMLATLTLAEVSDAELESSLRALVR
ncbi:MAG: hypothetical protein M3680_07215 [Myxococcota bacterium]|nr:hypothetical protein [Myxococcota bacterium]